MQIQKNLVKKYYDAFQNKDMNVFLDCLSDDVIHDLNQEGIQIGKKAFSEFMDHMNRCYNETVHDLVIMANEDGKSVAAKFVIKGKYLVTDHGMPEAKGQEYEIPVGAFFSIKNNQITRVTSYYNLANWLNQVNCK